MSSPYWKSRRTLRYYKIVRHLLEDMGPGELLVDVGSSDTPVATFGDFQQRISVDLCERRPLPGVEFVIADWIKFPIPRLATVVTCLQVLEHLSDDIVQRFAEKLLASGRTVIVSVPYKWKRGQCRSHRQDPIDETKLRLLMGRDPLESITVTESPNRKKTPRLIAVYRGTGVS